MAKFRFPGKALKLNTRKRVRFRGSHATHTPEELYTRRIRKGLDLFTQIFGDSDEDEDEFEGFISGQPEARVAGRTGTVPPRSRTGKRAVAQKAEEVCLALEEAGLATTRRTSVVEGAVSEVREEGRSRTEGVSAQERVAAPQQTPVPGQDPLLEPGEECVQGARPWQVAASNRVTRRQTNHRISRPPTVKTALAKKLLAKAKKKVPSLPVVGEKSPKRFILPTMSVRSSRIIKPNKRLFADITEICSPGGLPEAGPGAEAGEGSVSVSSKRLVKLTRKGRGSHTQFLSLPRSRAQDKSTASGMEGVRRTISIYTEAMTGPCKGQVGRPPKRRMEAPQQEVEAEAPDSPQRCDPKESRVKEKIEKLLRSPWDNRLKQTAKGGKIEGEELMPAPSCTTHVLAASTLPRNILRRPRLNLNKTTLQRLRNPASLQRFIPACEGGSVEGKCAVCDIAGENFYKFGILFCEMCSSFLDKASAGLKEVMECLDGKGECQVQGLEVEDRCPACWLYRVLTSCSISNILHDHLRKRLPPHLKERVPTSLARCMSVGTAAVSTDKSDELASHMKRLPLDPGGGGAFGSVIDLPGGWRRKTGPEVIVISPSGEKFRSVQKLEEFLKKQGIRADARVLFGNSSPAVGQASESEAKSKPSVPGNGGSRGKVVMTMLPGGWTRRIKWRSAGDRFDTYVYSPDGRTFRSRRELSAYFSLIGKVDDIHKYFPVVTGNSDASIPSSSDTPGSSSTEPVSSSEPCSEVSSDDKSPELAACQASQRKHKFRKPHLGKGKKSKISQVKPQKLQEKARSKLPTQVSVAEKSVEERDHQDQDQDQGAQASTSQFKQKQKVSSRVRTLSAGRKEDTSLTDTTESESEQRKPETIQMFSKTYTRGRSRKSKQVVSPPLFGNNSSSVCSPQFGKDKASSIAQETQKDTSDGNDTSTAVDAGDVNLSGKKQKMQDEGTTSPEQFTVLPESGDKESSNVQEGEAKNTSGKASQDKRTKKAADQGSTSPEPSALPVSDSKPTTKIVLKIPKKAIKIKPVRKKMNRGKRIKKENNSAVKEEKQTSKLPFLEDKSWETKPLTDTKKLSDVTQGKLPSQEGGEEPAGSESDGLVNYDTTDKSRVVTSPSMSEGEGGARPFVVPGVKKIKPQKSKKCETQHFGQGWSRRIRWNDRGEGRVSLLYSPDGQSFRSRIELSAYFKKAGKPRVDLDYYFPLALHRPVSAADKDASSLVTSTSTQSSESSEFSDSDAFIKTSEDSWASSEETRRSRLSQPSKHYYRISGVKNSMENMVEEMPLSSYQNSGKPSSCLQTFQEDGRKLMPLPSKGGKNIVVSIHEVKRAGAVKSETEDGEELLDEAGGPRVKHVCRSQAQVLRITRAVFPSPKKEEDSVGSSVVTTKPKGEQKRKIVTVTTTSSGKVLRKTQWCGKCPGCTTPNCLKCSNCLDMKKYGGPGTKKKPCIMRKCQNPRLSIKSAGTQEVGGKTTIITTSAAATASITTTVTTPLTSNSQKDLRKVSLLNLKVHEEKREAPDPESDSTAKSLEPEKGGVFIPRQMTRIQPDQKDRGDIAAGKQFVPSALVNIDYWQGYDADEMMLTGYPVTTASPLHPQILCFRCGSLGKEQLLYCAWCCEGIHPYCLEDGEGPESEAEEVFWICRRCAVCHVCGAPGADSLLRCSDCRNYYHLECLGPSAHSTCQPTQDRPWEADLKALLGGSWPRQSAIYDVSGGDMEVDGAGEDIVIHTELDTLKEAEDEDKDMPDIFFLPVVKGSLISSLSGDIEDDEEVDFEDLEDSVCLEDGIVEVFRDADLYQPAPSPTANPCGGQVTSMREDEYLYLGYKKLCEYPSRKLELSYYRLLQIIHNEHFATLGYPTWKEMLEQQQVVERPTSHHAEPGSDTDTASEGPSEDEENNLDWEEIFETRRFEAMQEMKEREGRKRKEEMRRREEEREKARLEKQKELEREAREKELAEAKQKQAAELIFTPKMKLVGSEEAISKEEVALKRGQTTKKRRGRPPGSLNKPKYGDEDFVILDDADKDWTPGGDKGASTPRRRCKQPTSWEEFDRMFARLTSPATMAELMGGVSDAEQPRTRRRVIHSDRGIVGGRRRGRLKYNPCDQKIKPVDKSNLMSVRAKKLKKMLAKKKKQNLASKSKHMLKDCKIPMKRVKVSRKSPHSEDEAQSKNEPEDSPGLVIKKEDELRFEASKTTEEQDSVKISVSSSSEWPVCGARVGQTGSAEMDLKKHDSGLEMEALAKGRGKHEEENSDKENLPRSQTLSKVKENGIFTPLRDPSSSSSSSSSSSCSSSSSNSSSSSSFSSSGKEEEEEEELPMSEGKEEEEEKVQEARPKRLADTNWDAMVLPEKRVRRSIGRASELASQRKALLDY